MRVISFTVLAVASLAVFGRAQLLVRDIYPGTAPYSSSIAEFVTSGAVGFFRAEDGLGHELWVTDSTVGGTRRVADIAAGSASSRPSGLIDANGQGVVLFAADDGVHGGELWRSDGTEAGTYMLRDIVLGSGSSRRHGFWRIGSDVYFIAQYSPGLFAPFGDALWRSDGTAAGTTLVYAFGEYALSRGEAVEFQGRWYFAAASGPFGSEPWSTDGTANGTRMLADLSPGLSATNPRSFKAVGNQLYFVADTGPFNPVDALWTTDGTAAGTTRVLDLNTRPTSANRIYGLVELGGRLVFATDEGLWESDGTAAGTVPYFTQFAPFDAPFALVPYGNQIYFTAGPSLWSTDGTAAGTASVVTFARRLNGVVPAAGLLCLAADDGVTGTELWISDGTAVGTLRVSDVQPGPASSSPGVFGVVAGRLICTFNDGVTGQELWQTDGFQPPTRIANVYPDRGFGSSPGEFVALDDRVLFAASDPAHGRELWVSDGSSAGTRIVQDLVPGIASSSPTRFTRFGGAVYFTGGVFPNKQLWRTDGVTATAVANLDISSDLVEFNGRLYFSASPGPAPFDQELWASDGTSSGTVRVADIIPGTAFGSRPHEFVTVGGSSLFFVASTSSGRQVWQTNGTASGTVPVGGSEPRELTAMGSEVFFSASTPTGGRELWKTDGATTVRVRDIAIGPASSNPTDLLVALGRVWFGANDGTRGVELWSSDGTTAGTVQAFDLDTGPSTVARPLGVASGELYFEYATMSLPTNTVASGLYRTDGTLPGTTLVAAFVPRVPPGSSTTRVTDFALIGDVPHVVFSGENAGDHDHELWVTDGTTAGTFELDLDPQRGTAPAEFTLADRTVFFRADAQVSGSELWAMDVSAIGAALTTSFGAPCLGSGSVAPLLTAPVAPRLGDPAFALEITAARPQAVAAILFGSSRATIPVDVGCDLLVGGLFASVGLMTDVSGAARLTFPLTSGASIVGFEVVSQGLVADPAGALGLASMSAGLRWIVGS